METHIKVIAIVFIILGILGLLTALMMLVSGAGVATAVLSQANTGDERAAAGIVGTCFTVAAVAFGVLALPTIAAGWGLMNRKSWARILTIIIAILNLPGFPIGTAVGVYALWVMFNDETKRLLAA